MEVEKLKMTSKFSVQQKASAFLIKAKDKLEKPIICKHCGKERSYKVHCEHCFSGGPVKENT